MSKNAARVVPFDVHHVDLMEFRELEERTLKPSSDKMAGLSSLGMCGTMIHDGRILGVIGYYEIFSGTFEVFVLPTRYVTQYPVAFVKTVRALIRSVTETHNVKRFQTASVNDDMHNNWMRFIGFECEGVMRNYIDGLDYCMWGRVYGR